jgi:hypothetical protein
MSEINKHEEVKVGSEKSFGIVFAIVFLIIALYPLLASDVIRVWALIISFICLFLAYFLPGILSIPNKLWFKLGLLLGSIVTPIVMSIIYFVSVMPTGIIMKLLGKDLLNQHFNKNKKSYWVEREKPVGPMKNQF